MKYGQTWWGNMWLRALSHIDYSNRLPRGRTYANKGAVKSISFNNNVIHANVQGTMRSPYKIKIDVPLFKDSEKSLLMDAMFENPLILSKLLNRELPQSLNSLAEKNKIKVFPKSWTDFGMKCSCPDWAVPCKHLAAVINIMANEIDRNPFIIFRLHGLDIMEELERTGFSATQDTHAIPKLSDYFGKEEPSLTDTDNYKILEEIDFSLIQESANDILSLMDDNPLFYDKDFKPILSKGFKRMSKHSNILMKQLSEGTEIHTNYEKYERIKIQIVNEVFFSHAEIFEHTNKSVIGTENGFAELVDFLNHIAPKQIKGLCPGLLSLYFIYHFSLKLLQQSAFVPQLLQLANKKYVARWIPALLNEEVKNIFTKIVQSTPPGILKVKGYSYEDETFEPSEQVKMIISLFLGDIIHNYSPQFIEVNDSMQKFFFQNCTDDFSSLGQQEIPVTIQKWLDKLFISNYDYVPVIQVDDIPDENSFEVSVFVENKEDQFNEPIPLHTMLTDEKYREGKISVLRNLSLLSQSFPQLESVISKSGDHVMLFDSEEFPEVLFKILPSLKLYGIKILLPKALKNLARPQLSMSLQAKSSQNESSVSYFGLDEMLDFQWTIALGDKMLSKEEFMDLIHNYSGIVKLKNHYIFIDKADIERILKSFEQEKQLTKHELLQTAVSEEYEGAKIHIDKSAQKIIQSLLQAEDILPSPQIKATLRPYQLKGYQWLYKNAKTGFGSIIADDMGLGKTLQVITLLQKLKDDNKLLERSALVVVPTTLLTNWQREIERFAPEMQPHIYHGPKRKLEMENIDVVITTYGIARSDIKLLGKSKWSAVIIDEAQNIKNQGTEQTKAIKKLKSDIRIAMSGTPVENRLSEYWSIFDFVNKGYLGSVKKFKDMYAAPIEIERDQKKLDMFLKITGPFILRRLKTDKSIISDLPDKVENDYFTSLTTQQTAIYQNVLNTIMTDISGTPEDEGIKRKGLVLKLMTALKQVCNHPSQYLNKEDYNPEISGKAMVLLNLLENMNENNEKVLIFTQYKEMGHILSKMIHERFDMEPMFLHGGTSRKQRDEMVDRFQNNIHERIFILSIKAGGTGLNLTAANNVVHYDLWWNPAVEAQATDRAYRIGQKNKVMVYRLITKGTFEEKINIMLQKKKELANLTVSTGEKWIGDLSNDELKELVAL